MHIAPYDNQNQPIVGAEDPLVPLCYFNIVKLTRGESFVSTVPGYETGIVPATGTIDVVVMDQVFANLIWSPFGTMRDGVFSSGWIDLGIEYLFSRRDLFGGSTAAGAAGEGEGTANRLLVGGIIRF